jgi:hypothetical protein
MELSESSGVAGLSDRSEGFGRESAEMGEEMGG